MHQPLRYISKLHVGIRLLPDKPPTALLKHPTPYNFPKIKYCKIGLNRKREKTSRITEIIFMISYLDQKNPWILAPKYLAVQKVFARGKSEEIPDFKEARMILRKFAISMVVLAIASMHACFGYAAQEAAQQANNIQDQGSALLMNAADFLAQAKQFSVDIQARYDVLQSTGEKIEFSEVRNVALSRPDLMRVDVVQSDGDKNLILFNGREIIAYSPDDKMYATASMAGNVDQAITFLIDDLGLKLPLAMMFVTKLPSEFKNRVRSVAVVEKDVTMDVPNTHLAVRTDEVDFQIWIPSEGDPLPSRVVITYKNEPGQPQFSANFSKWNLAPKLPEGFFAFTPPPDAKRIQFLAMAETARPKSGKEK